MDETSGVVTIAILIALLAFLLGGGVAAVLVAVAAMALFGVMPLGGGGIGP